eukprot:9074408-Alexandrium_andersonii.AAC.1
MALSRSSTAPSRSGGHPIAPGAAHGTRCPGPRKGDPALSENPLCMREGADHGGMLNTEIARRGPAADNGYCLSVSV